MPSVMALGIHDKPAWCRYTSIYLRQSVYANSNICYLLLYKHWIISCIRKTNLYFSFIAIRYDFDRAMLAENGGGHNHDLSPGSHGKYYRIIVF